MLALNLYPLLASRFAPTGVSHTCHLGGALFGYLFFKYQLDPLYHLQNSWNDQRRKQRSKTEHKRVERAEQDDAEMDRILRKISEHGIGNLSAAEKKFLDERSRHLRDRGR
jgi:hypothetical protein